MTAREALKYIETDIRYHEPTCAEDVSKAKEAELCLEYTLDYIDYLEKLVSSTLRMDKPACERLLDLERILEIIKKKGCSYLEIALIFACNNYEEYCLEMNSGRTYIGGFERERAFKTQKEFDSLKEVLK